MSTASRGPWLLMLHRGGGCGADRGDAGRQVEFRAFQQAWFDFQ